MHKETCSISLTHSHTRKRWFVQSHKIPLLRYTFGGNSIPFEIHNNFLDTIEVTHIHSCDSKTAQGAFPLSKFFNEWKSLSGTISSSATKTHSSARWCFSRFQIHFLKFRTTEIFGTFARWKLVIAQADGNSELWIFWYMPLGYCLSEKQNCTSIGVPHHLAVLKK